MPPAGHTAPLRFVMADGPDVAARLEVAAENRAAAAGADDARLAFAAEVARHVEGGRAAILRPASRRALLRSAAGRRLRPFDANLIIAIVQDAARRGEDSARSAGMLRLIDAPAPARHGEWRWAAAVVLGLILFAILVTLVV